MNTTNEPTFSSGDVAPNPFLNGPEQPSIPTIPGFEMTAVRKSPINVHGVLTLGILAIAGVAIWGMRSIGLKGLMAGQAPQEISAAMSVDPSMKPAVMTIEDQRLLADLNASRTKNQVAGDSLQKNPFSYSDATRPRPKTTANAPLPDKATPEQIAAAKQQELLNALESFKLQGVMGGAHGVARINGKPFRVGETFGEKNAPQFTVSAIEGREVTVTSEGFSFIMSMDSK